jgi:hypothetical protein
MKEATSAQWVDITKALASAGAPSDSNEPRDIVREWWQEEGRRQAPRVCDLPVHEDGWEWSL